MSATSTRGVDRRRLGTFLGLLVVLWAVFQAVSFVTGIGMVQLAPMYMFTPLVAGVITVWRSEIGLSTLGLRIGRLRWVLVAAVAPLGIAALTVLVSLAVPGITFSQGIALLPGIDLPGGIPGFIAGLGIVLILGVTANAVVAFGEEIGWRGYLLWELAPLGFWRASVLIGMIWGLWHAPAIVEGYNFPSFPLLGVLVMTLATITFSVLYTYLVIRAESVLAAVFFHGVFNASGGLVLAYTTSESAALTDLVASPVGGASIVVFLLIAAAIYLRGPPSLTRATLSGTDH